MSSLIRCCVIRGKSSAHPKFMDLVLGRSAIYMLKSSGVRTDFWGGLLITFINLLLLLVKIT